MMVELPRDKYDGIAPLLKERIDQGGMTERVTPAFALSMLKLQNSSKAATAFVDRVDSPGCVLIVSTGRLGIFPESVCLINFIYVSEAIRNMNVRLAIALGKEMLQQAEAYARQKNSDVLRASSWVWRDESSDVGSFYLADGFELQSHEYIKTLKTNTP